MQRRPKRCHNNDNSGKDALGSLHNTVDVEKPKGYVEAMERKRSYQKVKRKAGS
jgi:hypothetical protein